MEISGVISAIVIGAIIGLLGRLVVPGRQHIGVLATVLVGLLAAFLGAWVGHLLGLYDHRGLFWVVWIIQIGLAALGIVALERFRSRRQ
ncbi:GlsB/YeaQ/YmgE family stress response membrane protein [Streptomyces cinnamoneus]|uniref:GlsB/YeaQ/YmgE family stress response membrane protein n=1 Tax=Streptomyces TaxID=1883 RepID=UPI001CE36B91|nr:GlsB/YeaQ/YmgE family stress response membrane protein [Streptomyces sichuanensis]MCA6093751.1 GlsB/YeaQ/YmgE family stress response membrane protein [Streptomyces sichuanensis]